MSHYFTNDDLKSKEKLIYAIVNQKKFAFLTDNGVFSKSGLDFGTRLLIETSVGFKADKILDLGCGYGPIGIVFGSFWRDAKIDMVDVNERAVKLAKKNLEVNDVKNADAFVSDGFEKINQKYDLIITNPPIRAGKKVVYDFFEKSFDFLTENGRLVFVINKKQGAESAIRKCETIYRKVEVLNKKSGYMIIGCKNN